MEQDSRSEMKECDELLVSHRSEIGCSRGRLRKDVLLFDSFISCCGSEITGLLIFFWIP